MLPDLHLSTEELAELGQLMGGCDFSAASRRAFLCSAESCDVHAAPGSGKTTLVVAKLLLLSRRWPDTTHGVCVVSHTNAARSEIEQRIAKIETAGMLAYPHFVGTATAFVHRFVALPFLRGLGWPIQEIDDDAAAGRALRRLYEDAFLSKQWKKKRQFEGWAEKLTIADQFEPHGGVCHLRVPVRDAPGMPGNRTSTRQSFERIKADVMNEGVYRYEDMSVLAEKALDVCPAWTDRLASRFPLVILDEAQDSSARHLALIDRIFRNRSIVQRLGDRNQTIYDSGTTDGGWVPLEGAIDLGESRRFGPSIASFATRLTVRLQQVITGLGEDRPRPLLLTYREGQARAVIPTFAGIVADKLGSEGVHACAVASVHRPTGAASGVSLRDYHPEYRAPDPRTRASTLDGAVRSAVIAAGDGRPLGDSMATCARAVVELLRRQGIDAFDGRVSHRELWPKLHALAPGCDESVRSMIQRLLVGDQAAADRPWEQTRTVILEALEPVLPVQGLTTRAKAYLRQEEDVGNGDVTNLGLRHVEFPVADGTLRVNLGSIASVKGESHDATLVVQTKMSNVRDVQTALMIAAGLRDRPSANSPTLVKATTNVFVGSTRPRRLLCLALPANDVSVRLMEVVTGWEWNVLACGEQ